MNQMLTKRQFCRLFIWAGLTLGIVALTLSSQLVVVMTGVLCALSAAIGSLMVFYGRKALYEN